MQAQKASRELESYTADELEVLWNVAKADESL